MTGYIYMSAPKQLLIRFHLAIDVRAIQQAKRIAKKEKISASEFIRNAVNEAIELRKTSA
jgi:hypothetical protein